MANRFDTAARPVRFAPHANNFMRYMVTHDCARPWFVYAEAFAPAFLEAFITIVFLDLEDLVRNHGYEITQGSSKGTRRGITHMLSRQAEKLDVPSERWAHAGLKTLLKFTIPLEIIGFAWLMYGAGDKFFYRFQSLLEQSVYCTGIPGMYSAKLSPGRTGILPTGDAIGYPFQEQNTGGWGRNAFFVALPFGHYTVSFALNITRDGTTEIEATPSLFVTDGFVTRYVDGSLHKFGAQSTGDIVFGDSIQIFNPAGGSIAWVLKGPALPVGVKVHSGSVMVMRQG